jgi:hypothetical protein
MSRQFTTTPQYIDFGLTTPLQGLSEFTLSIWVQTSTLTSSGGTNGIRDIVSIEDTSNNANITWVLRYVPSNARFEFDVGIAGGLYGPAHSANTIAINTWYNIVCQYDAASDNLYMYVNGTIGSNGGTIGGATQTTSNTLRVGAGNAETARQWAGLIGEFAFWDSLLTSGDISNLAAGSNPETVEFGSLIFYSQMQGTSSPEPCLVGAYSGTVTGSPGQGSNPPVNAPPVISGGFVQEVIQGPPIRGAPWVRFIRVEQALGTTVGSISPPIVPEAYAPEIHVGPPMRGAPWFHYSEPIANYNPPVPNAIFLQRYAPEIVHGPPMHGAPWFKPFTPPENALVMGVPPPPVIGTPALTSFEVHSGPFPAPWNGGHPQPTQPYGVPKSPYMPPPGPPVPPTPPPPASGFASTNRQLIPLVPSQDQRSTKASQITSEMLNSLQLRGQIFKTGTNTWAIAGQPIETDRPPTAHDDKQSMFVVPGTIWVDVTNSTSYVNISNAVGAAVWKQIT